MRSIRVYVTLPRDFPVDWNEAGFEQAYGSGDVYSLVVQMAAPENFRYWISRVANDELAKTKVWPRLSSGLSPTC